MRALVASFAVVALVGCQRPTAPTEPTVRFVSVQTPEELTALWEASQETLREHLFRLDRKDLREHVVTTFPETSQQPVEFWRSDVATGYDRLEAALSTQRRAATVRISADPLPAKLTLDVEIRKEQFNTPEREINDAAAALQAFSPRTPTTAGRAVDPTMDEYWAPRGRDGVMEARIADRIIERYTAATGS